MYVYVWYACKYAWYVCVHGMVCVCKMYLFGCLIWKGRSYGGSRRGRVLEELYLIIGLSVFINNYPFFYTLRLTTYILFYSNKYVVCKVVLIRLCG